MNILLKIDDELNHYAVKSESDVGYRVISRQTAYALRELLKNTKQELADNEDILVEMEKKLRESEAECERLKGEIFITMRSGASAEFPVSYKFTAGEAQEEVNKLDKIVKFFPHYYEKLNQEDEG
jgi:hypothetical protein